jgi:hypothetical protein
MDDDVKSGKKDVKKVALKKKRLYYKGNQWRRE